MQGDQLARQWRVMRAIEASPNGLIVAEISIGDRHMAGLTDEKPFKSLFQKLEWAFLLWGTEASGFRILFLNGRA